MSHVDSPGDRGTAGVDPAPDPRRWRALTVLALVQFIIFLDATIVNVALPSIQADLDFTPGGLTWVINAYLLAAGGLLLLGGRLADIIGRRRMFSFGAALFAVSSLVAALAQNQETLITGRFLQGIAEAVAAPAAMSMVALMFTDPAERGKAFAIWGGLAGLGSAAGVALSGILTDLASWRWVFLITIPLAVIPLFVTHRLMDESKMVGARRPSWAGALLLTVGLITVIHGVLAATENPIASTAVLLPLVGGLVLLGVFGFLQTRSDNPLVPLSFFAHQMRATGNVSVVFLASTTAAMFFMVVLYMQDVLGYSPLQSGLAWLPFCVAFVPGLNIAMRMLPRSGPRGTLAIGLVLAAAGLFLLATIPVEGSYWLHLLPAIVLIGLGGGMANPAIQTAALADVSAQDAGLGSGVLTTVQQLGQALGLSVIVMIALNHTTGLRGAGEAVAEATVGGYQLGFVVAGGVLVLGALLGLVMLRRPAGGGAGPEQEQTPEAVPAAEVTG